MARPRLSRLPPTPRPEGHPTRVLDYPLALDPRDPPGQRYCAACRRLYPLEAFDTKADSRYEVRRIARQCKLHRRSDP